MESSSSKATDGRLAWEQPKQANGLITGLMVRNSLAGNKVLFVPQNGRKVSWYGCGPTVYDSSHMGHARNYISFDIIRRVMEDYFGYDVDMVMNITDIDDKIIASSKQQGVPFDRLARFWENAFFRDMDACNVRRPDVVTRVSEHIPQIISFIEGVIQNQYAYESNGSVYFDIESFRKSGKHSYGRMEPWSVCDESRALEGEGSLSLGDCAQDKRCNLDFALWKKVKEGEPAWDSPWGPGRPGWHIECSAMASSVLSFPLDVHSGGIDLRFPHHDNELAQSEAHFDTPNWVNYFLHSGHLHIEGLKMSKSLKNFITIEAILEKHSYQVLRLLFAMHKWDQPMSYTPEGESMDQAEEYHKMLRNFFGRMKSLLHETLATATFESVESIEMETLVGFNASQVPTEADKKLSADFDDVKAAIHGALQDNFDTPLALIQIKVLIGHVNKYLTAVPPSEYKGTLLLKITSYVSNMAGTFGLKKEAGLFGYLESSAQADDTRFVPLVSVIGDLRRDMRILSRRVLKEPENAKKLAGELLKLADVVRDVTLPKMGIQIEDAANGAYTWKYL